MSAMYGGLTINRWHTADNAGDTDRVHIIFDAVTNLFPMGGVPVTDDDDVISEECGVGYDRH